MVVILFSGRIVRRNADKARTNEFGHLLIVGLARQGLEAAFHRNVKVPFAECRNVKVLFAECEEQ